MDGKSSSRKWVRPRGVSFCFSECRVYTYTKSQKKRFHVGVEKQILIPSIVTMEISFTLFFLFKI
jgi:hypothetical protein